MNFPDEETRNAFLAELKALETKYGFGFRIGGWECVIDFGPNYSSVGDFREAMKRDTCAGWDDVARYGPPVPRELRNPLQLMYEDALRDELNKPLWGEPPSDENVVLSLHVKNRTTFP